MENLEKNKKMKFIIIGCLVFAVILVLVVISIVQKVNVKKDQQMILDDLEEYGYAYCGALIYKPWFDEYMLEILPTLSDQEFIDTIEAMISDSYNDYDMERLMTQQEMADLLLPKLFNMESIEMYSFIVTCDCYGYYNPYLLDGIKNHISEEINTIDDLYQTARKYNSFYTWEDADYYKFSILYSQDDLMEYVENFQKTFYKESDMGGYYDGNKDIYSPGAYNGQSSSTTYHGDFKVFSKGDIYFDSNYNVEKESAAWIYFCETYIPGCKEKDIDKFEYYTGQYLIWIDGNQLGLVNLYDESHTLIKGITLK